jgi:hypothetical protein
MVVPEARSQGMRTAGRYAVSEARRRPCRSGGEPRCGQAAASRVMRGVPARSDYRQDAAVGSTTGDTMLLCSIHDIRPGMVLGAQVTDPRSPDQRLLLPGVTLDATMIASLVRRGIVEVWVEDDLTKDLDAAVAPQLEIARLEVYAQLRDDLKSLSKTTLTTASIQAYRQAVMGLVTEAISSAKYAGLTGTLFGCDGLATHGANVAYLSLLCGLHAEAYVVAEQTRLDREQAGDMAVLGLAGMLHDVGKARQSPRMRAVHEVFWQTPPAPNSPDEQGATGTLNAPVAERLEHVQLGRKLLEDARAPARVVHTVLNHHQRYDGRGWPDMTALTGGRIMGPLKARQIHVFARVVAAANVLENLMRDAKGSKRPPVAALWAFASNRFDGWFDPVVRRSLLLRVPPFAVGTEVKLSDGRRAVVVAPKADDPCRPEVRALTGPDGQRCEQADTIDLSTHPPLKITHAMGDEVGSFLYSPPPPPPTSEPAAPEDAVVKKGAEAARGKKAA